MTSKKEKVKTGTFKEFQDFTIAVARGEREVDPKAPKIWIETRGGGASETAVQFASLEAGAKLLSAKNRELLRLIVTREPQSVAELADMAHRAPQNVQRTRSAYWRKTRNTLKITFALRQIGPRTQTRRSLRESA